jgi:hypothetical protein
MVYRFSPTTLAFRPNPESLYSWKGTLQQYVGRLHRLHDAKHVVRVYDYVDCHVLMLARMYARRLKGYGAIGYRIGAAAADAPSSSD